MKVVPYDEHANARKIPLDKCQEMFKQMMVMSRINIKEANITNSVFRRQGGLPAMAALDKIVSHQKQLKKIFLE